MRPMSMREMHALCFERGIEFDPATLPVEELADRARVIVARPVWDGRSLARRCMTGGPPSGASGGGSPTGSPPRT